MRYGELPMLRKIALFGVVAAAALFGGSGPGMALPGPWCLRYDIGSGVMREQCNFESFEACNHERTFWGSTAFCSQNPGYFGPYPQKTRKSKRRPYYYY
jgi:hypothetical protein